MILRISIGGYPLTQETMDAMDALRGDRLLFRSEFEIQPGGVQTAASVLQERKTPNLLIVEMDEPRDTFFQKLEELANVCDPDTRLILISTHNDILLFQELIKNGVSDYLVGPVDSEKLRESIAKVYAGHETDTDGKLIAFYGLSGGVGNSVVAHNTARELARLHDKKSIVVDLDICYGTAALNFNVQPRQTVVDALSQTGKLDTALMDQYLVSGGDNVSILASPASLSVGMQITHNLFDQLLKAVKPMADFIILDLPHLWAPWISDGLAAADEVILVGKPDLTNLRNAKSMVEFIGPKRGVDAPTRLVLNQVGASKKSELSDKEFKEAVAITPAAMIPYDADLFGRSQNNGELLSVVSNKSKTVATIIELAEVIGGENVQEEEKKSFFSRLKKSNK
ncbi:MAG: AAA family ATPase [Rhodospirillales bacterium]|nr:AAA family ATPase [Rhodospirillales bacterium]